MKFPKFLRITVNELGGVCELGSDSNGKVELIGGAEREFLKTLTEVFNFRYELVPPPDANWGSPMPGGNWSGMVGMIQRDEADVALCSMVITEYREEIVTFTREYDIQHMLFATRNPENLPRFRSIILPFSPQLWFGVWCLLIIMPIVWKYLLEMQEDLGKFYMYVLASLLKLSIVIKCARKCGHYILLGSWFWGVAAISAGYSAVLLSFVTLPVKEDVIREIPRLAKAVAKGTHKCYAFRGSSSINALLTSNMKEMRDLGTAIIKNRWLLKPSIERVVKLLEEKNVALIGTSHYFLNQYHNTLTLSKDFFYPARIAVAVSKNFCCRKILDKKVRQMMQAGLFKEWYKRSRYISFLRSNISNLLTFEHMNPLHIDDMYGAFLLLTLGCGIAAVVLVVEIIFDQFKYWKRDLIAVN